VAVPTYKNEYFLQFFSQKFFLKINFYTKKTINSKKFSKTKIFKKIIRGDPYDFGKNL